MGVRNKAGVHSFLSENLKEMDRLWGPGTQEWIILKWILKIRGLGCE
jgi:hypothetical protein